MIFMLIYGSGLRIGEAVNLRVDVSGYSLWGGSAGGRMTDWVGTYGTSYFGEKEYPKPSALIIEYTGLSEVTGDEPPTYSVVGTNDEIANYKVMQNRINRIKANGTNAEIEVFNGLPYGFGIGEGTIAEWLNDAVDGKLTDYGLDLINKEYPKTDK